MKTDRGVPDFLVLCCIECKTPKEVPYKELDDNKLAGFLWKNGEWLLSVVSKFGAGKVVVAPLCPICAPNVHLPTLLKAAREHAAKSFGGET